MVSPNFRNEVIRISVSDTKYLLSGYVSLTFGLYLVLFQASEVIAKLSTATRHSHDFSGGPCWFVVFRSGPYS